MVDFGGWEMPIKYPTDIVAEHLYTRNFCSLFDVSHMGRILVDGPQAVPFLQHVLSSNVMALDVNKAQYAILPTETGGAVDDATSTALRRIVTCWWSTQPTPIKTWRTCSTTSRTLTPE